MNKTLIEVCVGSLQDAITAQQAGGDRLELCAATELGGLTPSAGLLEAVAELSTVPVIVMIRPRAGGFCYSQAEYETAFRDLKAALHFEIAGVAFGFLQTDGQIDPARCEEFVKVASGRETVFHRAFDLVPDPLQALDTLIELGVTRVLTSGQGASALQGAELIASLTARAAGRIEILPGGGIRAANVSEVVRVTGCEQVHVGASTSMVDDVLAGSSEIAFHNSDYLDGGRHRIVDAEAMAAIVRELRQ